MNPRDTTAQQSTEWQPMTLDESTISKIGLSQLIAEADEMEDPSLSTSQPSLYNGESNASTTATTVPQLPQSNLSNSVIGWVANPEGDPLNLEEVGESGLAYDSPIIMDMDESLQTMLMSPFVGIDRHHCLRRIMRLSITAGTPFALKLTRFDQTQVQGLDALMVSMQRADHRSVVDVLKNTARFSCIFCGKLTDILKVKVLGEGLCFWDTLFWLDCHQKGKHWTSEISKRKGLLAIYIQQLIESIQTNQDQYQDHLDILEPALAAASRAAAYASGSESYSQNEWGRNTWFPMFARGLQSSLWHETKRNAGAFLTVANDRARADFNYAELAQLSKASAVLLSDHTAHFCPFMIKLKSDQLESMVAAFATALISRVNE